MNTVQEFLRQADSEQLINMYLYDHPVNLNELPDEVMSLKDSKEKVKTKLRQYIERLRTMEIEKPSDGQEYVLFAHKVFRDISEEEEYSLVCVQELLDEGTDAKSYAYECTQQAEIVGFKVADTKYTQKNLNGLLVDVLYRASFFGFEQEYLEEKMKKLDEAIQELEEGNSVTYSLEEIREHLGLEKEEVDSKADELKRRVLEATIEYEQYCKKKELQAVIALLHKE